MSSCPAKSAKRVFALDVPGIHVLAVSRQRKDVDGRDIGERKRRRPSDGYGPAMTAFGNALHLDLSASGRIDINSAASFHRAHH
jgi:hypothetical protein